jgi:seryl-tRNA synthetase
MLDIKAFKKNPEFFLKGLAKRGTQWEKEAKSLMSLIDNRSKKQQKLEQLQSELNSGSKTVPTLKGEEKKKLLTGLKKISDEIAGHNADIRASDETINQQWKNLPNLPSDDVKIGKDESENITLKTVGTPARFDFTPLDHTELGKRLDLIDTETAGIVSGPRFGYLKNEAVLLQFALIQFGLSVLTSEKTLKGIIKKNSLNVSPKPFVPIIPPMMIKEDVLDKMARLEPKDERYQLPQDNLYLVGSAEHTLGPILMNQTVDTEQLPIRYVGYSSAFRREAGSYGKDTKGIFRVHQFDKLEMETFTLPDQSTDEQNFIIAIQEHLLQSLALPYRLVQMCTGDMTAPDARQIDVETWMPSQQRYRETHTSDLTTDYQSRRLNIRYQDGQERGIVHMNDATAFAIGRTLIAVMENYQQADGSIGIPKALQPYMNGMTIIKPK